MLEGKVTVVNPLGLHARAAAQLVRLAGGFESSIVLIRSDNQRKASARSIFRILGLAASQQTILEIRVEGTDESAAFEAVKDLFNNGFGEI